MKNHNEEIDLRKFITLIWKRKFYLLEFGIIGLIVGTVISFSIPKEYITKVKLAAEENNSMNNLADISELASLAGFEFGKNKEGISPDLYPEVVISTPFLMSLADIKIKPSKIQNDSITLYDYLLKYQKTAWWNYIFQLPVSIVDFFSDKKIQNTSIMNFYRPGKSETKYLERISNRIDLTISRKNGIITIEVKMQNAEISAIIASKMIENLQNYMINYKTLKSRNDLKYIATLYEEAKKKYLYTQTEYARAIDKNKNIISASSKIRLDVLLNEQNLAFSIYNNFAQKLELAKAKVQDETPVITLIEPAIVPFKYSSPKKITIIIVFVFLGCCLGSSIIIIDSLKRTFI